MIARTVISARVPHMIKNDVICQKLPISCQNLIRLIDEMRIVPFSFWTLVSYQALAKRRRLQRDLSYIN